MRVARRPRHSAELRNEIEHFFQVYKDLEEEKVETRGYGNRADAERVVARGASARRTPDGAKERGPTRGESTAMAARRKKRPLRPRVPSRVKKRTQAAALTTRDRAARARPPRARLVLAADPLPRLDGGAVGSLARRRARRRPGRRRVRAADRARAPSVGCCSRAATLLDVRPFRLGVGVSFLGLMTLLGKDSGGWIGMAHRRHARRAHRRDRRGDHRGRAPRSRALLLVTGASTGAILRRTGHAVQRAGSGARRAFDWPSSESQTAEDADVSPEPVRSARTAPACSTERRRTRTSSAQRAARRSRHRSSPTSPSSSSRASSPSSRPPRSTPSTGSPIARSCALRPRRPRRTATRARSTADLLVRTLSRVRRRGDRHRADLRPARDPLRAPARARDEGVEGRRAEGRPLVRARDDRDQDPRPDSRQAGGRRRGPEPLAEARHARRHLRRPSRDREPARPSGSARTSPATRSGPTSRGCRTS